MSDTPFRGILHGVTEVPGYERPAVDGELCEDWPVSVYGADGRPELVSHSAREMLAGFLALPVGDEWWPPSEDEG